MASCPNCGRRTLRTKDWVCQWCGYPLLGGGYKLIEKTYKELQEERNSSFRSVKPEPEFDFEPQAEPAPKPRPQPQSPPPPPSRPQPPPVQRRAPEPDPEPVAEAEPEMEIQPEPPPVIPPYAPPAPPPAPAPELAPPPRPEQLPPGPPEPELLPEAGEVSQTEPPPPPSPVPEPEAAPEEKVELPRLSSITEGTRLTIDQIEALFRADITGAHMALKDKTIIIKGMVNKVFIRDHLEIRYLILDGAHKGAWSARCTFGKEASVDMSRLSEGQVVALRGKYDGYSKNIIFKDCTLLASI